MPGAPAAPGIKISKLDQSCPTCGSCDRVSASSVVVCSPFSVFRRGTSVVTTTSADTAPTANCALIVVFPTGIVTDDRTRGEKPALAKVSL